VLRGQVLSADSRSHATSSLPSDVIQSVYALSAAANSGAVGTGRSTTRTMDAPHEGSTLVLESTAATGLDLESRGGAGGPGSGAGTEPRLSTGERGPHVMHQVAASALAPAGARAAAAAAHAHWVGSPYRRPDTERTISGSWTNSNSSPTGTLASRVAAQSGTTGASLNLTTGDHGVLGEHPHSIIQQSVHQSVSSKSGALLRAVFLCAFDCCALE
jgi:hypothetical protein